MKMIFTKENLAAALLVALLPFSLLAQSGKPEDIALSHIQEKAAEWGLTASDVKDLAISDQYTSRHNGVTHVYFTQQYLGVPVYNAITNVSVLPDGRILHTGKRFIAGLAGKVNVTFPMLTAETAVLSAAAHLGLQPEGSLRLLDSPAENSFVFEGANLSRHEIKVNLSYQPMTTGEVRLAWDLAMEMFDTPDYWSMRVDALTGEVLHQNNWTSKCTIHQHSYTNFDNECEEDRSLSPVSEVRMGMSENMFSGEASYRVFAVPVESPNHGDRTLVVDPHDLNSSPYGWHDTDGMDGAEFTITRGNNAHAFYDGNADYAPPATEVDGGSDLLFDFPYDEGVEPGDMINASITNLFYMNNIMHDFSYAYGFDEVSGNFQQNNYGNGGVAGDYVNALGQFGGEDPDGFGAVNNAYFGTPPDGDGGTMRMFFWNLGTPLLEALEPVSVAGLYSAGQAEFGPAVSDGPVEGEVVEVNDGFDSPYLSDGCETPYVNAADLTGKIALVDRGGCFFEQKALYAEQNGAIAVILCNFEDAVIGMAGTPSVDSPTIPTISIGSSDCAQLRVFAGNGLVVRIAVPDVPQYISGDYDNGIIAHEFAHGISTRLTGGPGNSGCLGGEEQMGEGWSDFFSLVTTVEPGDMGPDRRGIGTYAQRANVLGKGIRNYPYSTDMDINPVTYSDITTFSVPHGVGSVWCSMLWDLYWAFVDEYGWDPDQYYGTGGNNMAVRLVMDGMKLQPCDPGFVDGRDAIMAADQALYGGANQCLIWEVFARRGLGYLADQGSSLSRSDGVVNFEPLPTCIAELKIKKSATEFIEAGNEVTFTVNVINHKPETVTNVVVTDELPAGLTYVAGSGTIEPAVNGNVLSFNLGDMAFEDEITFTYKAVSSPDFYSIQYYLEDVEESTFGVWTDYPTGPVEGPNDWEVTSTDAFSGDQSFFVENIAAESQQILESLVEQPVQGDEPALRFYHRFETETGIDGGFLQFSTNQGQNWFSLTGDKFIKNSYSGAIDYGTFTTPNLQAFSGNSNGWIASIVDLSDLNGQNLLMRFRFGTNEAVGGAGWWVDNIELMDLFAYNSEACVSSNEGDLACASAAGRGTIVESQLPSSVEEAAENTLPVSVFPNPAGDVVNIQVSSQQSSPLTVRFLTLDGREALQLQRTVAGTLTLPINVSNLPEGMYLVQIATNEGTAVRKVVVR